MSLINPFTADGEIWSDSEVRYWRLVGKTLERVFSDRPELAHQLWRELREVSPLERALILHVDPLQTAAELAGRRVTEDHYRAFQDRVLNEEERTTRVR